MASSNRHWPSMFKSKPCNSHHQWHHDINPSLTSTGCHRSPYASVSGCEERSPEPKPRWNPKPEQIRILEAIFNSGMVNPPRDEIRKIRAQLQEYGQVGDANVFYWFQNRKSRSKHKLRNLQNSKSQSHHPITSAPSSSSSSSSDQKSSPKGSNKNLSIGSINAIEISNSPTASVNQTYFQPHGEFMPEAFYFPLQHTTSTDHYTQGFGFSELSNVVYVPDQQNVGPCTSLLLGEIMNHGALKKEQDQYKLKMQQQQLSYTVTNSTPINTSTNVTVPSTISDHVQGVGESCGVGIGGATRSTVFINDMAFEVAGGPLNVREAFGDDAVLINSAGQPVLTNEWGVTLHSLQHGAFYYLI